MNVIVGGLNTHLHRFRPKSPSRNRTNTRSLGSHTTMAEVVYIFGNDVFVCSSFWHVFTFMPVALMNRTEYYEPYTNTHETDEIVVVEHRTHLQ